jgi:arylsulfatase
MAIRGVAQSPIEGVSFAHTFDSANAKSLHITQYFEMMSHRAIYHDGWRAVCPMPGPSFAEAGVGFGTMVVDEKKLRELDAKGWELYDLTKDPTETTNLAESHRDKLIEMIALWYAEAGKYKVLPLDSRGTARFADERPELTRDRKVYAYYPYTQAVPENVAAKVLNRAHSITVEAEIPKGGAEGVLICQGSNIGGYALFLQDGKLCYVHNYVGAEELRVTSKTRVPAGRVSLRYEFEPTGKPDIAKGKGAPGKAQLYVNEKLVGEAEFPYTVPLTLGIGGGVAVGRNPSSSVSTLYEPPFAFTGRILSASIDVPGKPLLDAKEHEKAEAKVAMARQ